MRVWCLGEEGREWVCPASQGAPSGRQRQCSGAVACGRRGLGTAVLARSWSRHVLPYMASGSPGECDKGQQTVPPWDPGGVKLSRGPRDMAGVRRKLSCFPRRAVKSQRLVGTLSRAWEPVFLTSSQPGTLSEPQPAGGLWECPEDKGREQVAEGKQAQCRPLAALIGRRALWSWDGLRGFPGGLRGSGPGPQATGTLHG